MIWHIIFEGFIFSVISIILERIFKFLCKFFFYRKNRFLLKTFFNFIFAKAICSLDAAAGLPFSMGFSL